VNEGLASRTGRTQANQSHLKLVAAVLDDTDSQIEFSVPSPFRNDLKYLLQSEVLAGRPVRKHTETLLAQKKLGGTPNAQTSAVTSANLKIEGGERICEECCSY